jgi:TetR/AcrR family transcriptional regulator, regulator of cefoperazone and chloramphenicol sensitivity
MSVSSPVDTRQRLIDVAGEVFAEVGYRDATVRDICRLASANIAAVNYHFGDKLGLYRAVFEADYSRTVGEHPLEGDPALKAPPEERLRSYVTNFLERLFDVQKPVYISKIVAREMVDPSEAFTEICDRFMRPNWETLVSIVRAIVGPGGDSQVIYRCATAVIGQVVYYKQCRGFVSRMNPDQGYTADERAVLADHITRFCLAGIKAVSSSR